MPLMDSQLLSSLRPKTQDEIIERLQELIRRHSRKFLKRNLRACPFNCKDAIEIGRAVTGCHGCGSRTPDICKDEDQFVPLYTKEELYKQFQEDIHDAEILVRNYRDVATLLWVLGAGENG